MINGAFYGGGAEPSPSNAFGYYINTIVLLLYYIAITKYFCLYLIVFYVIVYSNLN